jgi:dipeptidyl aminopeptidase/acylaminoacyl peptidase
MKKILFLCTLIAIVYPRISANAGETELLPIEAFFEPATTTDVNLSPSGRYFTAIRRVDGKLLLTISDLENLDQPAIGIPMRESVVQWVSWASDERILISKYAGLSMYVRGRYYYIGPKYQTIAMDRDGSHMVTLFEGQSTRFSKNFNLSRITDLLHDDPEHILMPAYQGARLALWKVNVLDGSAEIVVKGGTRSLAWFTDRTGEPVLRIDTNRRGTQLKIYTKNQETGKWKRIRTIEEDDKDEFWPQAASDQPGMVYVVARPDEAERAGVYLYDLENDELGEPVATHPRVDITQVLTTSHSHSYVGVAYIDDRLVYQFDDPILNKHMRGLNKFFGDEANVVIADMDEARNQFLLYVTGPTMEGSYYLYNVAKAHVELVADERPGLTDRLNPMRAVRWTGRDGTDVSGYLTTPRVSVDEKNLPMIVMPHGGPELRDSYSFDVFGQFLASRGYAVFQPNFRGSGGFGRKFTESGHLQWGRAMQDDITDGVQYLIDAGEVDPDRICIFGASYGGYAALAGAVETPDLYKCAIAMAAVTDLPDFLKYIRKEEGRGSESYRIWKERMGDPKTDKQDLQRYSPARQAARIQIPVLLIHGEKDQIVPIEQSQTMQEQLQAAGKESRLIKLEKAGHSYWSDLDEATAMREMELFFAKYIGGLVGPEPDTELLAEWDKGDSETETGEEDTAGDQSSEAKEESAETSEPAER